MSTGQGILGNNMFAYCGNIPVVFSDTMGYSKVASLKSQSDITRPVMMYGIAAAVCVLSTIDQDEATPVVITKPHQTSKDQYTVYFLKELGNEDNTIVYVGRVKTANMASRMRYHRQKGRELVFHIDGLDYGECRIIEQAGMIWCHTINPNNSLNNQIRGIGPNNRNRDFYYAKGAQLADNGSWLDPYFPISYWANQAENILLNGW